MTPQDYRARVIADLKKAVDLCAQLIAAIIKTRETPSKTSYMPPQAPQHPEPAQPPPPAPTYDWSTPAAARHSLRLICDEEGLTVDQKNLMSQVVHCESGYLIHAKHDNGTSIDAGICQWNSFYHWKEISTEEAFNDPEKAVRLMCAYVKQGLIKQWVCYSARLPDGRRLYEKYTP